MFSCARAREGAASHTELKTYPDVLASNLMYVKVCFKNMLDLAQQECPKTPVPVGSVAEGSTYAEFVTGSFIAIFQNKSVVIIPQNVNNKFHAWISILDSQVGKHTRNRGGDMTQGKKKGKN